MAVIRWTNQSIEDLKNIFDYISKDSAKYAKLQIIRIREHTSIISKNPRIGRVVPELARQDIREIIYRSYRIIYLLKSDEIIEILTIHHSSRILKLN